MISEQREFWRVRYQEGQTPWDLGSATPPLASLPESGADWLKPGKMAVLGAGYGHDAAFFGQRGFDVTGFDYVPEAIQEAATRYGRWARFVQADIFELGPEYDGQFDYVLEHTCFCAIPPKRRTDYVREVERLLRPGGYFLGLIFAFVDPDGPPYPSTEAEIRALFASGFELLGCEVPVNSIPARQGRELLCRFRRFKDPA